MTHIQNLRLLISNHTGSENLSPASHIKPLDWTASHTLPVVASDPHLLKVQSFTSHHDTVNPVAWEIVSRFNPPILSSFPLRLLKMISLQYVAVMLNPLQIEKTNIPKFNFICFCIIQHHRHHNSHIFVSSLSTEINPHVTQKLYPTSERVYCQVINQEEL
jgi:hypothetical protein